MRAIQRLLQILESVARSGSPTTPSVVARETGLSLSTVARLMQEMSAERLLVKSATGSSYTLGPALFQILQDYSGRTDPILAVRPLLVEVRDITGETTSLHVRDESQRVCIAEVQSRHEVRRVIPIGHALPLLGTATGEVLLAGVPHDEQRLFVDQMRLEGVEKQLLQERLDHIKQHGFAMKSDGILPDVTGISVPVIHGGVTIAALSCSGPTSRFTPERAHASLAPMREAADRIAPRFASSL